ncbi:MAG: hypothetical protein IJT39_05700 [Bacteroidales bacterium]|nr:hypothetical protein [Bacteroidales bacterium]
MNQKPTVEEAIALMGRTTYDRPVNVTDAVMQQVERQPLLVPRKHPLWQRWTVAASVAVLLSAGTVAFFTSKPSDSSIDAIFTDVYEYSYNTDDATICDEMAMASFWSE